MVKELDRSVLRVIEASLTPPLRLALKMLPAAQHPLDEDLSKLLDDTALVDVAFAVHGQHFLAHRCVLAARSPYFCGLFEAGTGMSEGGGRAAGNGIVMEGVSAGAFRMCCGSCTRTNYLRRRTVERGWSRGDGTGGRSVPGGGALRALPTAVQRGVGGRQCGGVVGAGARQRAGGARAGRHGLLRGQRDSMSGLAFVGYFLVTSICVLSLKH